MKVLSMVVNFGLGILLGCDTHSRSVNTAKPTDSEPVNAAKPSETQPPFTPAATLAQQKMCDEQAEKKFKEDEFRRANSHISNSYFSHYDPTVNVCYILVESIGGSGGSSLVYDAFRGRVYAIYSWSTNPQAGTTCEIDIPAKPVETCNSGEEFDALTGKYFGVAR